MTLEKAEKSWGGGLISAGFGRFQFSSFSIAAVDSDYGACGLCSDHAAGKGCINNAQSTCILFSSEQFSELNVLQNSYNHPATVNLSPSIWECYVKHKRTGTEFVNHLWIVWRKHTERLSESHTRGTVNENDNFYHVISYSKSLSELLHSKLFSVFVQVGI